MADPVAHELRLRAATLRALAASIASCDAVDLRRRAGADVWIGPTATRCHDELTALGRRLVDAADLVVQRSRVLDRRAAELEVLAASALVR